MVKITKLKANPGNPRTIKDSKFYKLVKNILLYSKFLVKRPIVHKDFIVQGGNMRYRAIHHILNLEETHFTALAQSHGLTEDQITDWKNYRRVKSIPDEWVADAADFTPEEQEAFIILDNSDFGEWNMEELANNFEAAKLVDWGLDFGNWGNSEVAPANSPNPMLETDDDDERTGPTPRRATDDGFAMYEQVLPVEDKKTLLEVLNQVKESQKLEQLGEALMHVIRFYQSKHKSNK